MCWSCWGRRAGNALRNPGKTYGSWAVAKVGGAQCTQHKGTKLCYGVKGPLRSLIRKDGITLGGTVLFEGRRSGTPRTLLAHEVSHGSRWAFAGSTNFIAAWGTGAAAQGVTGRCNPVER